MRTIVLTGGLGAGKSTAAAFFADHGATVLDLDRIGHEVLAPGSPTLDRVTEAFGREIVGADGALDRARLAERTFGSPRASRMLNAIVHPAIEAEVRDRLARIGREHPDAVVVLEVPLLAEAPRYRELADIVVAISARESLRVRRCVSRGMSEADARNRIAAQATDEEREALADAVIVNEGDEDALLGELERFWAEAIAPAEERR